MNYEDIRESVEAGKTSTEIAEEQTRRSSRYPEVRYTVNEVAVALTDKGIDADPIITSLMSALAIEADNSYLIRGKLDELSAGGTIDLGSYLQRAMLLKLVADGRISAADTQAILDLVEVPAPVTAAEVDAVIAEKAAADAAADEEAAMGERYSRLNQEYDRLYNIHLAPLHSNTVASADQEWKDALAAMSAEWVDQL